MQHHSVSWSMLLIPSPVCQLELLLGGGEHIESEQKRHKQLLLTLHLIQLEQNHTLRVP